MDLMKHMASWMTAATALGLALTANGCSSQASQAGEPTSTSTSQALVGDGLVISQIYGTNDYPVYDRNFVELFNRSSAPVSLAGLSLQIQKIEGNFNSGTPRVLALPDVHVPAGRYYLIGLNSRFDGGPLPPVDLQAPAAIRHEASRGKVALARGTTALPCGARESRCASADVVDLVGYDVVNGNPSDYEGTMPPRIGTVRRSGGCMDTQNNARDFVRSPPSPPRNSSSPARDCSLAPGGDGLVIRQIYAGGGRSDSTYLRNYVELFNRSPAPISLDGLSVQAAVTDFSNRPAVLPNVTVPPGGYFLVGYSVPGAITGPNFMADFDATGELLSGTARSGRFALANVTSSLGGAGIDFDSDEIVDLVGVDASTFEGNPIPRQLETGSAMHRKMEGCTDTDVNASDFEVSTAVPRTSTSPARPCGSVVVDPVDPEAGKGLVISQLFGAGGRPGAPFNRDFVELFNRGESPVSLTGLSLQYGSAQQNIGSASNQVVVLPHVVVEPGRYYLVGLDSDDLGVGAAIPSSAVGTMALDVEGGKVALARTQTPLDCGGASRCTSERIVDMVGYGSASDFEGPRAAPPLDAQAAARNGKGCIDTDDNAADFTASTPAPRGKNTRPAIACAPKDAGADGGEEPIVDGGPIDDAGPTSDGGESDDDAGVEPPRPPAPNVGDDAGDAAASTAIATDTESGCTASGTRPARRHGAMLLGAVAVFAVLRARRKAVRRRPN